MKNFANLDGFLKTQRDEGQTVTESASFTLDAARAWEKVAAHALPFENAWVLKLVQAAVTAECTHIAVKLKRDQTEFRLSSPKGWTSETIVEALFDDEAELSQSLQHLSLALRSLAKGVGHSFNVAFQHRSCLDFDGQIMRLPEAERVESVGDELLLEISNSGPRDRSMIAKFLRTAESQFVLGVGSVLWERAFCCPVPLSLDGRRVVGLHAHPNFAPSSHSRTLLLVQEPPSTELPAFVCPLTQDWESGHQAPGVALVRRASLKDEGVSLDQALSDVQAGYVVLLCAFMGAEKVKVSAMSKHTTTRYFPASRESLLAWVKDGIVVEFEVLFRGPVGVLVVASAQDLDTDLSGFQLVRNATFERRRRHLTAAVAHKMTELTGGSKIDAEQQLDEFNLMIKAVCGVVGLIFILPGIITFLDIASQRSREVALEKQLEEEFSRALAQLIDTLREQPTEMPAALKLVDSR